MVICIQYGVNMAGFSSGDDLFYKLSTLGNKNRVAFNKITTVGTTGVAGRVYDFNFLAGSADRMGYGEHLINCYAPVNTFNWTANGTAWVGTGGVFAKTSGTATTLTADSLNIPIVSGRFYRVQYTISAWTSSNVNFTMGGATGTVRAATGTFVEVITASSTAGFVFQASVNTGVFSISNVSVVEWGAASGTITPMFQPVVQRNSSSLYNGGDVSPDTKHMISYGAMTTAATGIGQLMLVDILGCYPYIDANSLAAQTCSNTNVLPRYADGSGVKAFLVSAGTGYTGAATTVGAVAHNVAMTYTNQAGTGSRQMPFTVSCAASSPQGQVAHAGIAANNFFPLPLANQDNGVRSIQTIQLSAASGTAGTYYHMVLYRELSANLPIPVANAYFERECVNMSPSMDRVYDGAVYGLIYTAAAATAASTTYMGHIEAAWG